MACSRIQPLNFESSTPPLSAIGYKFSYVSFHRANNKGVDKTVHRLGMREVYEIIQPLTTLA